jgi:hypothetical protein
MRNYIYFYYSLIPERKPKIQARGALAAAPLRNSEREEREREKERERETTENQPTACV